jgi:pyruvate/oxaloacetate carboxyltransferase
MDEMVRRDDYRQLKVQDNTLRDGHQSLYATRMRTEDMIPVAEQLDEIGFWALEVWGGATFDAMHRFLAEDPWDRLRTMKRYVRKTPLSMLIRGQNLVGYRQYPDDVVRAFVNKASELGIDIFRVFDALNDLRNLETCVRQIKSNGKHFQGTICYSLTERHLGGEIYNLSYYIDKCRELESLGADSICIKDMAGLMSPYDAYNLIAILKQTFQLPIHLHTHYTSGMASMTYLKAIEADVDMVDTCLAPFAMRNSMPAIEPLLVTLQGTPRDPGLSLRSLLKIGHRLEKTAPKYRQYLKTNRLSIIDGDVLIHQIPGGMLSNLVNQLKEMKALNRQEEVYSEIPITRHELGSPPLVTPISQIIASQAVMNVLFGKYHIISRQLKDLVLGYYGKTPYPIDPGVIERVQKGGGGKVAITGRPADYLEAGMKAARQQSVNVARTEEDVLTFALFPASGEQFLKWKYNLEEKPDNVKVRTPDDVKGA